MAWLKFKMINVLQPRYVSWRKNFENEKSKEFVEHFSLGLFYLTDTSNTQQKFYVSTKV